MSRPLRIEYPNAFYHVMNRGAGRQAICLGDNDYKMFLEVLKESSRFFGIRIISYCVMPNHYHLLIQTPKANLSRAMRHLNGVYTQRFNRAHKKDGPLFRGRYKAILIQADEYLTHLIRYIHLNPIEANITDHSWTSHKQYLKGKDEAAWLHASLGLSFFSSKLKTALKDYREFIKGGVDTKTMEFYDKKKHSPIFGEPDFIDQIKEKYVFSDRPLSSEIPEERSMTGETIANRILKETSKSFSQPKKALFTSKRGQSNMARLLALSLTRELSGLRLSEIAKLFKIKSYRTVGTHCYRFKTMMKQRMDIRQRYIKIHQTCSQRKT